MMNKDLILMPTVIFSAAVSYTVAEQFNQSIEMEAITRSSRIGRSDGESYSTEILLCDSRS